MSSSSNIVHLRQNYQIKIVLNNIKPPIWRRLVVDSRMTMDALHDAIQICMGWDGSHLHQFIDRDGLIYNLQDDVDYMMDFAANTVDESLVLINEVLKKEKDWISYEYDFGDDWEHKIILEKILPHKKGQFPVVCVKGKRACPPEDCGGPRRYQHMLEQLAIPDDQEEYDELLEWVGDGFDAEHFSVKDVNLVLKEIFNSVVFNGKTGLDKELQRIKNEQLSAEERFLEGDMGLSLATNELLDDPELSPEIKELIGSMQEAAGVVGYMDEMIEQSIAAFEKIVSISKDKKVTAIAKQMLNILAAH
ncbi:MAG: plasmid pRiA4b ORF-3 family protein [gamma proteobacterium symbiont of Bathyaustriella thionipta]|nr:plasmid pRiA4b ORF-3 family protein [gamma proteobacterium symbiont of Bathyaustriella thionipta]MCU7948730.1 plasmid pRiA4b ORF-3 family protein [gamma proteobacterium symbiont of Bathyaustriella thionipta]MCU7954633.1 plasmid pRiA4b ORF-3 family protein [gamma proteobacterium symbiont of Bathyaustriella thionipta]MCU7955213.1 plasmid pRiA4b ORF-3 family protein [gamma proteobacterium symbiont of Bathyaustriella thionipta]MCU7968239.1 plasmid pRiA4b ORF-3 family protein [gamma proteobacteri